MASEPLFEEQSDAVKVSETPYPTNGSGKNLAKNTGIKYTFCDYPMPDSLLRVILYSFLPSSFRICPPLKNDGTSGLCFDVGLNILTCIRKHAPIASQARHFPPCSGEANAKEERNYSFKKY